MRLMETPPMSVHLACGWSQRGVMASTWEFVLKIPRLQYCTVVITESPYVKTKQHRITCKSDFHAQQWVVEIQVIIALSSFSFKRRNGIWRPLRDFLLKCLMTPGSFIKHLKKIEEKLFIKDLFRIVFSSKICFLHWHI